MTATIKHPAIRYHGGKFRLAPWISEQMPEHVCYVEPFGGAAGVLLQKPRSYAEVYNDLDGEVVNLFRVLLDPNLNQRMQDMCALTPYARDEFCAARGETTDPVERAAGWLYAPAWDLVPRLILAASQVFEATANANTPLPLICGSDTRRTCQPFANACRVSSSKTKTLWR